MAKSPLASSRGVLHPKVRDADGADIPELCTAVEYMANAFYMAYNSVEVVLLMASDFVLNA